MNAVYDLSKMPANFNVMEFLGAATAYGATNIFFNDTMGIQKKYNDLETLERLSSIVLPCCDLMGVDYTVSSPDYSSGLPLIDPGYHISALLRAYKETGKVGFINKKHNKDLKNRNKYTITLRNSDRFPFRNSNLKDWIKFADQISAVIIPDYRDEKIPLIEKVNLWANSQMNFFVNNGPAIMCYLSDIPYLSFMKWHDREYHNYHGFPEGSQFPWSCQSQKLLWEMDTYENLMYAFEEFYKFGFTHEVQLG